jgi:hypothetical protein
MQWVRKEAQQAKALAGVSDGVPGRGHLFQLMDALGIELIKAPVAVFCCCWTPGGTRIIAPLDWDGDDRDPRLVEEVGHALFGDAVAPVIRYVKPGSYKAERLANLCVAKEESIVAEFVRVWLEDEGGDIQPGEYGQSS